MKVNLPTQMSQLIKSYISKHQFQVKCGDDYSNLEDISAGVTQGSVLGPILYLLYTDVYKRQVYSNIINIIKQL